MGTLMRLAMGFCDCFLNSSAFDAAAGVASVATEVPSAPTGVSWANSGKVEKENTVKAAKASNSLFDHFIAVFSSSLFSLQHQTSLQQRLTHAGNSQSQCSFA